MGTDTTVVDPSKIVERNVIEPTGIVQVMKNYWWWCAGGDPKRALFYCLNTRSVGSPQCNANHDCAEAVGKRLGYDKIAELIQIPLAFEPWEG